MLANKEFLESILSYIGRRLRHEVKGMLVGGNAMLYYGLKGQTKDLDLVFFKREDISGVVKIILSHSLYRKAKVLVKPSLEVKPELLKRGEPTVIGNADLPRFDIFYKYVFSVDTTKIFEDSKQSIRFELLKLKLINIEGLIFLKGVSARPVDIEDIIRIVKNLEVDWKKFVEFVKGYYKKDHKPVWFLLCTIYDLNKKEEIIPKFVVKEVEKLFE
jgi:hypothetical protein